MADIHSKIIEDTRRDHDYVVSLRRYFHKHPELSKNEFKTAETIEAELDKLGISHQRVDKTGVYAEIDGGKSGDRTIVLRADTDALPVTEEHECEYKSENNGVMHACGHDAHTASLIGAARVLLKNRDSWGGKIRLCFQQAEEVGYGGRQFVKSGLLNGADRSFGYHCKSGLPTGVILAKKGPVNASVDWFRITVHGKASHISRPHLGIDALKIASQIVLDIHKITDKDPGGNLLIGIGKMVAGIAYNIIAETAVIEGTIRAFDEEKRKKAKESIEEISKSIALSKGATVTFEWRDNASVLSNDDKATEEVQKVAVELFGKDRLITSFNPAFDGDDMADFINAVPGTYVFIGTRNDSIPETGADHHNSHFDIDEDSLYTSVALTAAYAIDYLSGRVD